MKILWRVFLEDQSIDLFVKVGHLVLLEKISNRITNKYDDHLKNLLSELRDFAKDLILSGDYERSFPVSIKSKGAHAK